MKCPSAQPDMEESHPFGVISGSAKETRIAFFKKSALTAFDWRDRFNGLDATQLFRFAARCEEDRCRHYNGARCSLGQRVLEQLPAVVESLPPCLIRNECRWFAERGGEVCLRCPQVVSLIPAADTELNRVALGPE